MIRAALRPICVTRPHAFPATAQSQTSPLRARKAATLVAGTLALSLATAFGSPARADQRLIQYAFTPHDVVRIDGRTGVQATIAFGEGEAIENVAVGDSAAWQITPNKRADTLFVKPLQPGARTNMTVLTDRHTYLFDLVASPKTQPIYLLRFTYKDAPKVQAVAMAPLTPGEQAALAGGNVADPALFNFAFKTKGDPKLMPARIYDDGYSTYLLWAEKSAIPAILVQNAKGEVGPVNYAVRGRTIVLDDVPRTILLRFGTLQATIENQRTAPSASIASPSISATGRASQTPAAQHQVQDQQGVAVSATLVAEAHYQSAASPAAVRKN